MSPSSIIGKTVCICDKVTPDVNTYSGGFKSPTVNAINFENIFKKFSELLASAPAVFSTVISILVVYVLLGIWVRRMDKSDVEKVTIQS